jgi:predicted enzyme related to lactoylglutathione lyase
MAKVLGVGGIFYKCASPETTRAWYQRVLGLELRPWGGVKFDPLPRGSTTWSPFKADSNHFAPSTSNVMINFVVDDLDAVLAHAKSEGVDPVSIQDDDTFGRFAWLIDNDGMKIELWQPASA